ncbi:hypothetical protein ECPV1252_48880 [Escherichia coli]
MFLDVFFSLNYYSMTFGRHPDSRKQKTWSGSDKGSLTLRTTSSILCVIASFIAAGKNQISITELVILSGISRQSVKRAIQTLEQAGQITVTRTTTNGRHEANAYYLPEQD